MIRRPPRSTLDRSSAASDVYKRQSLYSANACPHAGHSKERHTQRNLSENLHLALHLWEFILYCILPGCCRFSGRQILGNSSPSKISGFCDLQTCCCHSNLSLGAKYISFSFCLKLFFHWHSCHYICRDLDCFSPLYSATLLQDIPVSYTHLTLPTSDLV